MCIYNYTYTYIYRERERDTHIYIHMYRLCVYIYIYTYMYTSIYTVCMLQYASFIHNNTLLQLREMPRGKAMQ